MTQSESHTHVEITNSRNLRFQQHDVPKSRAETISEPIASCSTTLIAPTSIVHVAQSSANHSFLNVSEDDWRRETTDRSDNSKKMNMWAKNKFDAWQVYLGFCTDVSFENIDLKECGILLSRFFYMVCKSSGELYLIGSLMSMLMDFQRLICKEQERRINESRIVETTFDIRKHSFFGLCRRGLQSALEASRNAGVNKKRRKVGAITWEQERIILDHELHATTNPRGCQMRFGFYCFIIFFICGNKELYNLLVTDFVYDQDANGKPFLR